jgi:hypothetical protein
MVNPRFRDCLNCTSIGLNAAMARGVNRYTFVLLTDQKNTDRYIEQKFVLTDSVNFHQPL